MLRGVPSSILAKHRSVFVLSSPLFASFMAVACSKSFAKRALIAAGSGRVSPSDVTSAVSAATAPRAFNLFHGPRFARCIETAWGVAMYAHVKSGQRHERNDPPKRIAVVARPEALAIR